MNLAQYNITERKYKYISTIMYTYININKIYFIYFILKNNFVILNFNI